MKKNEITDVLTELHKITGFRISLHAADYSEIAAYPVDKSKFCTLIHGVDGEYNRCVECDKEACRHAIENKTTYIYRCRYGMTEAMSPLYNFGILTGFLVMGQVFETDSGGNILYKDKNCIEKLGPAFAEAIESVRNVRSDMVESYVKIMTICAQYLTLSNAIPTVKKTVAEMAKEYILENYQKKFTISDICHEIGCSKSTLLTDFKKHYGITVNSYVTDVRLDAAAHMLSLGKSNIGEIASATGFSDQSYFSKVFSAEYGMTPSEFQRKEINE